MDLFGLSVFIEEALPMETDNKTQNNPLKFLSCCVHWGSLTDECSPLIQKIETFSNLIWKDKNIPGFTKKTELNGVRSFPMPNFLGTYFGYTARLKSWWLLFHTGGIDRRRCKTNCFFQSSMFSFCNFFLFPYNSIFLFIVLFGPKSKGECKKILRGKCVFFDVSKPSRKELHFEVQLYLYLIKTPPFR